MRDKRLDPEADRKLRTNFAQRFLTSLHDLRKIGRVECVGTGKGVRWKWQRVPLDGAGGGWAGGAAEAERQISGFFRWRRKTCLSALCVL